MDRYQCQFPNCTYTTENRNKIDSHHIVPVEQSGSNDSWNRIWLCPNCHRKIFIPTAKSGMHSKRSKNSVELINKIYSTAGYLLEYKDVDNQIKFHKL